MNLIFINFELIICLINSNYIISTIIYVMLQIDWILFEFVLYRRMLSLTSSIYLVNTGYITDYE